jgi:methylated-DNA-[protein]-cysteine S-methyltransferase
MREDPVTTVSPDVDRRFREAAVREGLVDVMYDLTDSPVGTLLVASTERGVCRIGYDPEQTLDELPVRFGLRVLRIPGRLDRVRRELEEYFAGRRREFDLPLDLRVTPFQESVLRRLALVPFGRLETYAELARQVGKPRAARAVGMVMNRNPIPIVLPCHRIVGSDGSLTGYGGGLDRKEALLRLEGALL